MPISCENCRFSGLGGLMNERVFCMFTGAHAYTNEVQYLDDCPLVPVPEHGDLIDRDAMEQDAQKRLLMCNQNDNQFQKPYEVMRAIALAPTIIPAEGGDAE